MTKPMTHAQVLKVFKAVLKEAAALYKKPAHAITMDQFAFASNGRMGHGRVAQYGGFACLREYTAPSPKGSKKADLAVLERILRHVKVD